MGKKKDKANITHVLIITDMSGSMSYLAPDVRGGFNSYIKDLKEDKNAKNYRVSVTLFDHEYLPLCSEEPLKNVPEFTEENYTPRGWTALLDAVGRTLTTFSSDHKLEEDDRVLVMIQTDGYENHSREYDWNRVKEMIQERERTGQWQFVYLGSVADAWDQASRMGLSRRNVVMTQNTVKGTASSYRGMTIGTTAYAAATSPTDIYAADEVRDVVDSDKDDDSTS